ncbi:hypothetical protein VNO78_28885 [Psophocarpus tetragonolobus]|uniref:Uncharacterized protein n=1 Tax=Psophocarpus tetragonolobus TaxID=3891 RepID=A0AAN9RU35_PSOTE
MKPQIRVVSPANRGGSSCKREISGASKLQPSNCRQRRWRNLVVSKFVESFSVSPANCLRRRSTLFGNKIFQEYFHMPVRLLSSKI